MDAKQEVQQFLTAARGRISPEQAGVSFFAGERRVPGLRREEVGQLAGVSTAYYTKMERGDLRGVSEGVLLAVARGLQLDDAETTHLLNLGRAFNGPTRLHRSRPGRKVSPGIVQLIDTMRDVPVVAQNHLTFPVASNALGRALFHDLFPPDAEPLNHALFIFLDERARTFYPDWEENAHHTVSAMRLAAGRDPDDRGLIALVGRLATQSREFRTMWGGHTVRAHVSGSKRINHPLVGLITVSYEVLPVPASPGVSITSFLTEPATPSADAIDLLRTMIADPVQAQPDR
ncbi:helix-turn-helix transcriptional regulator [Microbacterium pygmaeum]|uniref:Helix-turn-helix domain-containing protein n=1 Tax=Microbacterium pygmaeum TaxID=370764 RepID=A0A1G7XJ80_9MICO|nr:helix-turn-helix transcriptional regulator [Microbacterium pygmaeum]SDG84203.1 Helix-turn-helix domain-containing protein [Microbacterium pygmaeum]